MLFSLNVFGVEDNFDAQIKALDKKVNIEPKEVLSLIEDIKTQYQSELTTDQELQLSLITIKANIELGEYFLVLAKISEIKPLIDNSTDVDLLWSYYNAKGKVYWGLDKKQESLNNLLKAYQIIKDAPEKSGIKAVAENNIGYASVQVGLYNEAIPYLRSTHDYSASVGNYNLLANAKNNLGEAHFGLGNYGKAYKLHNEALAIRLKHNFELHLSYSYHNLGLVYTKWHDYEKAKEYLAKAIAIRNKKKFINGEIESQLALVKVYQATGEEQSLLVLLNQVIKSAEVSKRYLYLSLAHQLKTEFFANQGDYKEAFYAIKKHKEVTDKVSIFVSDIKLSEFFNSSQLVTKDLNIIELQRENQIKSLEIENEKIRTRIIVISGVVILSLLMLFLMILHKSRLRLARYNRDLKSTLSELKETQAKLIESEKMASLTTLISGMAHQVNTPLGIALTSSSYIKEQCEKFEVLLQTNAVRKSALAHFLHEIDKACDMTLKSMHRAVNIVGQSKNISTNLEVEVYKEFEVIGLLEKTVGELKIKFGDSQPQVTISGESIQMIGYPAALQKIIAQLMDNAVEHGFDDIDNPQINIEVTLQKDNIELIFQDNGIGLEEELVNRIFDPFYTTKSGHDNLGIGLSIVYNLITHLMQGKVVCDTGVDGIVFRITLPLQIRV